MNTMSANDSRTPQTIGEVIDQLSFMTVNWPPFREPGPAEEAIAAIFDRLDQGLANIRHQLSDDSYNALIEMSDDARKCFEHDPYGDTKLLYEGWCELSDMRALLFNALPRLTRNEMIALARPLESANGTEAQLHNIMNRLRHELPHSDVLDLLFDNEPHLTAEQAIDEALRREAEWRSSNAP